MVRRRSDRTRRHPCRYCRRTRTDPRGDRLFDHRRGRSARRPLCLDRDRDRHLLYRRAAGDDFGGDRCGGRPRHSARPRTWRRISLRRDDPDGRHPDYRRIAAARPRHAVRIALGDHRVRQRARYPHLHGTTAAAHRCDVAGLCDGRGRACHHLPAPTADEGRSLAAHRHPDPLGNQHRVRLAGEHGRRHGQAPGRSSEHRPARRTADFGNATDHPSLFADNGRSRPARIAPHRADRR